MLEAHFLSCVCTFFPGCNRVSVGMKGVGVVEKKRLSSSAVAICGGLRGENIALQGSAAQIK